jgi:hypothetical protein
MPRKKDKSSIQSFDVTFGKERPGMPPQALGRWNILVCSDLGFASKKPQQVRISDWDEFIRSQGVMLSGAVPDMLAREDKPLYVELPVKSMKSFLSESIIENIPLAKAFAAVLSLLRDVRHGKASGAEAAAVVEKSPLPWEEKQRISSILGPSTKSVRSKQSAPNAAGSSVDRILSMVDPAPSKAAADAEKRDFAQALAESVSGSPERFDTDELSRCIDELEEKLFAQVAAIRRQPFFADRKASWSWLMALAKTVGRKPEAQVAVFSAEAGEMLSAFDDALGSCVEQEYPPDLVAWDFEVSFTNASVEVMTGIASVADTYKCVVVAPVAADEPLLQGISGRESIAWQFDDPRFLPYKKLRNDPRSRCLCLCGPALSEGSCAWYAAIRLAEMLILENDPVCARGNRPGGESIFSNGPVFSQRVAPDVAAEAAAAGLTLFEEGKGRTLDGAVTVVSAEAAAQGFRSLCFNLLVNRVMRRCGERLLSLAPAAAPEARAAALLDQAKRECAACGVEAAVETTAGKNGAVDVSIDSTAEISSRHVRFSFSA